MDADPLLRPGALLQGRYRILEPLAEGGMGRVFLAHHEPLDRRVALKALRLEAAEPGERQEWLAQFQAEGRILASLDHPNLVRVLDSFQEGGLPILVMEFLEGRTLHDLAALHPPTEPQVLDWAAQILEALAYLHGRRPPVLVRDLKPANLMQDPEGRVRLIDFGLARLLGPGARGLLDGMGSAGFAAPEQYGAGPLDERTDLYALGATLRFLLDSPTPRLRAALQKLMAPAPADRPSSAAQAATLLGLAPPGTRSPKSPRPQPPGRHHMRIRLLREIPGFDSAAFTPTGTHLFTYPPRRELAAWLRGDPEARRAGHLFQLFAADTGRETTEPIRAVSPMPSLSADGSTLAFERRDGRLEIRTGPGFCEVQLLEREPTKPGAPLELSPDGSLLVDSGVTPPVLRWTRTGEATALPPSERALFDPSGSHLALLGTETILWDLRQRRPRATLPGPFAFLHGDRFATSDGSWLELRSASEPHRVLVRCEAPGPLTGLVPDSRGRRVLLLGDGGAVVWDDHQDARWRLATPWHEGGFVPGRDLAWLRSPEAGRVLWDLRTRTLRPLPGREGAFHPAGRLHAWWDGGGSARLADLDTGRPLGEPIPARTWLLAFDPWGRRLLTSSGDSCLLWALDPPT